MNKRQDGLTRAFDVFMGWPSYYLSLTPMDYIIWIIF
jgi:hypothetical protein